MITIVESHKSNTMNSPLEQIFNNCALIVTPGANILNDGASFRWENSCVTS